MKHYYFKAEFEGRTFYIDEWAKNKVTAVMMAKKHLIELWELDENVIDNIKLNEY